MKDLKAQLIRLGSENPNLQKHLRPILNSLHSKTSSTLIDDAVTEGVYAFWKAVAHNVSAVNAGDVWNWYEDDREFMRAAKNAVDSWVAKNKDNIK